MEPSIQSAAESESSSLLCRRSSRIAAKPAAKPAVQPSAKPAVQSASKSNNSGDRIQYPLRKSFTWNKCFELSQRYKLAIYQNCEARPEAQSTAVKAVFFHEQDYPGATTEERKKFHHLCGDWCKFKIWENQGKPIEEFTRKKKIFTVMKLIGMAVCLLDLTLNIQMLTMNFLRFLSKLDG